MKRSARIVLGFIFSSLIVLTVFQNCSQPGSINVTDPFKAQREAEAERLAIGADDETVVVGLNQVPNLKMFFVVDNSGTMQKNQFNLSESFGSMFDPQSSGSLSKFDATTFILNTAQKSPSFSSEKSMLDKIVDEQKNYKSDLTLAMNQYTTLVRDNAYNYGYLPGDNLGYQVKISSSSPLKYDYAPSVVLGASVDANNNVSFKTSIRKLASENSAVMEDEFKKRLAILNADRIPLVQDGATYKPRYASVVDSESGLCAVARILRNPDNYFKSGEMVSFTIVSDENDNDPKGFNCVQNVTEFTGAEDVVDGECRQRESSISYQTTTAVKGVDVCKLNGYAGYNFRFNYTKNKITTEVKYKSLTTAAKYTANYTDVTYQVQKTAATYKAPYTELTYKINQYAYQYLYTNVTYYNESCYDIVSDGLVVGQKCSVVNTAVAGTKEGNFTSDCYAFAKSLSAKAVNSDGYKPVCTTVYKAVGSCNKADPYCKESVTLVDKKVATPILGLLDSTACLNKAKTYSDYAAGSTPTCKDVSKVVSSCTADETAAGCSLNAAATYGNKTSNVVGVYTASDACLTKAKSFSDYVAGATPTCVANNKTVTTCSAAETAAGCVKSSDPVYGTATVTANGDLTSGDGCYNYAKSQSNNAVSSAADISGCTKIETAQNLTYDSSLSFSEVSKEVDGGVLLAVNADCGVVKSIALAKAQKSVSQLTSSDKCTITAVNKASETVENVSSDCTTQANNRCNSQNLRSCTGTFVAGATTNVQSAVTLFKKVTEDVRCNSKCNSSVMDVCEADKDSDMLVSQYLKKKFGDSAVCTESVKEITGSGVAKSAVLASDVAKVCQANLQGVPSYFAVTKAAYRTKSVQVEYVTGNAVDSNGQSVPKLDLVSYIKERSQALANGNMAFSALVRTSQDALGYGGTYGADYEKLISETKGQLGSVLSNDYSLILKDLSAVLKSSIERTFVLKKMKAHQVIKKVSLIKKSGELVPIDVRSWSQNGATIVFASSLEINDGDQFKIDFANY